jgi:hypothetical protein
MSWLQTRLNSSVPTCGIQRRVSWLHDVSEEYVTYKQSSGYCVLHAGFLLSSLFDPEDGGDIFLLNFRSLLPNYGALIPEVRTLHNHHCENLKSNTDWTDWKFIFCYKIGTLIWLIRYDFPVLYIVVSICYNMVHCFCSSHTRYIVDVFSSQ